MKAGRATLAVAAVVLLAATALAAPNLGLVRLETLGAHEALGLSDPAPRFGWALVSAERGVRQSGFRVLVASKPELVREGKADVWDSQEVASAEPWLVYSGPALASRTRYYWSVRVRANGGQTSDWAPPTWFETAFLAPSEWKGQWIAGPDRPQVRTAAEGEADDAAIRAAGEFCRPVLWLTRGFAVGRNPNDQGECREIRPAPRLRKAFRISKPVTRARVYSSGLAYNDLAINGRAVSTSVLDPGFTDYSRTVLHTTHDVTALLSQGENVIASELGSGHYDDATRTWDWGWRRPSGGGRRGCGSTSISPTRTGRRRWWLPTAPGR